MSSNEVKISPDALHNTAMRVKHNARLTLTNLQDTDRVRNLVLQEAVYSSYEAFLGMLFADAGTHEVMTEEMRQWVAKGETRTQELQRLAALAVVAKLGELCHHEHSCVDCHYLGRTENTDRHVGPHKAWVELYSCLHHGNDGGVSVIARYGDATHQQLTGYDPVNDVHANPYLAEAWRLHHTVNAQPTEAG
jgi:hypothetical protein